MSDQDTESERQKNKPQPNTDTGKATTTTLPQSNQNLLNQLKDFESKLTSSQDISVGFEDARRAIETFLRSKGIRFSRTPPKVDVYEDRARQSQARHDELENLRRQAELLGEQLDSATSPQSLRSLADLVTKNIEQKGGREDALKALWEELENRSNVSPACKLLDLNREIISRLQAVGGNSVEDCGLAASLDRFRGILRDASSVFRHFRSIEPTWPISSAEVEGRITELDDPDRVLGPFDSAAKPPATSPPPVIVKVPGDKDTPQVSGDYGDIIPKHDLGQNRSCQ